MDLEIVLDSADVVDVVDVVDVANVAVVVDVVDATTHFGNHYLISSCLGIN